MAQLTSRQPCTTATTEHHSRSTQSKDTGLARSVLRYNTLWSSDRTTLHTPIILLLHPGTDFCRTITGLPRIATDKIFEIGTPISRQQTATSLPSFATFQEHATRADEPDEVEIAPMSARLPCSMCSKLKPMINEVATAIAELERIRQTSCGKPTTRVSSQLVNALHALVVLVRKNAKDS